MKKKKKQLERSFPSNTHKTISIQQNERLWNEFTRLNRETKSWDKKQENKHQNNANPNYIIRRSNLFTIFMIKSYKFQLQANHIFDAWLDGFSNKYRISKFNQHFEIIENRDTINMNAHKIAYKFSHNNKKLTDLSCAYFPFWRIRWISITSKWEIMAVILGTL